MFTTTRSRRRAAVAATATVALALILSGCGEYTPLPPESERTAGPRDDGAPPGGTDQKDVPGTDTAPGDDATPPGPPADASPPDAPPDDAPPADRHPDREPSHHGTPGTPGTNGPSAPQQPRPGGGAGPKTEPESPGYVWALPTSDTSIVGNDGPAYGALKEGCAAALTYLDAVASQRIWGFFTPRYAVLYVASLAHCLGRTDVGNVYATGAIKVYGDQQLFAGKPACDLYRVLLSVRDQVAPESVTCIATGTTTPKEFPAFDDPRFDDPCTFAVDESVTPPPGFDPARVARCGPVTPDSIAAALVDPTTLFDDVDLARLQAEIAAAPPYAPPQAAGPPAPAQGQGTAEGAAPQGAATGAADARLAVAADETLPEGAPALAEATTAEAVTEAGPVPVQDPAPADVAQPAAATEPATEPAPAAEAEPTPEPAPAPAPVAEPAATEPPATGMEPAPQDAQG